MTGKLVRFYDTMKLEACFKKYSNFSFRWKVFDFETMLKTTDWGFIFFERDIYWHFSNKAFRFNRPGGNFSFPFGAPGQSRMTGWAVERPRQYWASDPGRFQPCAAMRTAENRRRRLLPPVSSKKWEGWIEHKIMGDFALVKVFLICFSGGKKKCFVFWKVFMVAVTRNVWQTHVLPESFFRPS